MLAATTRVPLSAEEEKIRAEEAAMFRTIAQPIEGTDSLDTLIRKRKAEYSAKEDGKSHPGNWDHPANDCKMSE